MLADPSDQQLLSLRRVADRRVPRNGANSTVAGRRHDFEGGQNMRVKDLMSANVKSCSEDTDLATAAKMMWDGDCGLVPVLNDERHITGVITDRDICIAAATRSMSPAEIRARDVMARDVATCAHDADVRTALTMLKERRVRRLPVVDEDDRLVGVISMNDLVNRAECRRGAEVSGEELLDTLKAIGSHASAAAAAT